MHQDDSAKTTALLSAFIGDKKRGNTAYIIQLASLQELSTQSKQDIAQKNAVAATVFYEKPTAVTPNVKISIEVEWYSPTAQIYFCGHGALALAQILFNDPLFAAEDQLYLQAGDLPIEISKFTQTQAANPTCNNPGFESAYSFTVPRIYSTNIQAPAFCKNIFSQPPFKIHRAGDSDLAGYLICIFDDAKVLRTLSADTELIIKNTKDVIIATAASESREYDYETRVFVPQYGVDEDAATGSANVVAADYWQGLTGKNQFSVYQCSKQGGEMYIQVSSKQVTISGKTALLSTKSER